MELGREAQHDPWSADQAFVSVVAQQHGTRLALTTGGEADADTADQLRADLMSALCPALESVAVDLNGLSFCDTAGSDALHDFVDEASRRGLSVELRGMSPLVALIYSTFRRRRTPVEQVELPVSQHMAASQVLVDTVDPPARL